MKTDYAKLVLAFGVAVLVSTTARAHDTWLNPKKFAIEPNAAVTLDLTSGMKFPKLEVAPKRERVEIAQCRVAGRAIDITDITSGKQSLVFKVAPPDAGVATLWVKLLPKDLELKPAQVQEYLKEIDAPESLRSEWANMKPQRWRERYTKHTKSFVRVGSPQDDRSVVRAGRSGTRDRAGEDPTSLRPGVELAVRVLKGGAPHRDFALNAVAAGAAKGETKRTDAEGRVTFRLTKAGSWLLRGTDVRKVDGPEIDWESDFATLTISVLPK
jgi:uncharacterized GH25 family protein